MKIHIVNYEQNFDNWILTKYAKMMERELIDLGHEVTVSNQPDFRADINHHINSNSYKPSGGIDTMMVTHTTDDGQKDKVKTLKKQLKTATGICFSQSLKDKLGLPLEVVLPAHDGMRRRPRIIAMAYRIYPDGRKREKMLAELFKTIDPEKFTFRIMGDGWKKTLDPLVKKGLRVQWVKDFRADFYEELLNTSDYLLYTGGEDALAQSIIDAKNSALRIIAPPQADIEVEYPFNNQEELNAIFKELSKNPVKHWTWENYVKEHLKIWEKLYAKRS